MEEKIKRLIEKYKKGLCNEHEIQVLNQWIQNQCTSIADYTFQNENHEAAFKEDLREDIKRHLSFEKKEKVHRYLWLKIAAILILASTVGYWGWTKYGHQQTEHYTTIYNPAGHLQTITLPDNSKVYLNADTKISFPDHFNTKERKVILIGEAYFEVMHDAEKPFIIATGKLRTQVLGTSFNVQAYANEPKITVAVTNGKVGVMSNRSTVLLTPNQTASYDIKAGSLKKETIDDASLLRAWTNGELVFKNQSLRKILKVLVRRYGIAITIQNGKAAEAVLNARFDKNESLENVLKVLSVYVGSGYKREGNSYIIR